MADVFIFNNHFSRLFCDFINASDIWKPHAFYEFIRKILNPCLWHYNFIGSLININDK